MVGASAPQARGRLSRLRRVVRAAPGPLNADVRRHLSKISQNASAIPSPHEVDSLLSKLCIDLGFCLPQASRDRLRNNPPEDVLGFVDAVFVAERLDPATADRQLYRRVRDYVAVSYRQAQINSEF